MLVGFDCADRSRCLQVMVRRQSPEAIANRALIYFGWKQQSSRIRDLLLLREGHVSNDIFSSGRTARLQFQSSLTQLLDEPNSLLLQRECDGTAKIKTLIKCNGRHLNTSGSLA